MKGKTTAQQAPIITVAAIKGGTAKTVTTAALAQAAAFKGARVLALDMDPQANLTAILGAKQTQAGTYSLLTGSGTAEGAIQETPQGIDIMEACRDLSTITEERGMALRILKALETVRDRYSLILIDVPPSAGVLVYAALYAADMVIAPTEADPAGLQGLYNIADLTERMAKARKRSYKAGAIITRYDGRPKLNRHLHGVIEAKAGALGFPLLATIRNGVPIKEAMAMQENIFTYCPKAKPALDYMGLYETIMDILKGENTRA